MAGGRPLKFKSVEELKQKIEAYFSECDNKTTKVLTKSGDVVEIPDPKPYTVAGLAYYLGVDRDTLLNYEDRPEYFGTIKRAKDRIHAFVEESLWQPKITSGVIFNLKNNFNWVDKQEVDSNSKVDATITVKLEGELDEWGN